MRSMDLGTLAWTWKVVVAHWAKSGRVAGVAGVGCPELQIIIIGPVIGPRWPVFPQESCTPGRDSTDPGTHFQHVKTHPWMCLVC